MPAWGVVLRCNAAQRKAGLDHTPDRQTRPSHQIRSSSFKQNGYFQQCPALNSASRVYRGVFIRGRSFAGLNLQFEKAHGIFWLAHYHKALLFIFVFAGRRDTSLSPCLCLFINRSYRKLTTHRLSSRCIMLCDGYFSRVFGQLFGDEGNFLRMQWRRHVFLRPGKSGDQAPCCRGPARLGRRIRFSKKGPHATQRSVRFPYKKSFQAVLLCSFHLPI